MPLWVSLPHHFYYNPTSAGRMTEPKAYAVVAQTVRHIASRIWPLPKRLTANTHPQGTSETAPPPPLKKDTYKALYDLRSRSASELSLVKDEMIQIVRKENDGKDFPTASLSEY